MEQKTINALKWMVKILNRLNISYQIAGGFAAKMYGSPRSVNDIDFDVHDEDLIRIAPEISEYIKFGPAQFKDNKWDCMLITLEYEGQEIDISGADTTKISNLERTKWIEYPRQDFNTMKFVVEGTPINVMNPVELMEYKSELDGEHQVVDVGAVKKYLGEQVQK
jgi:hypothetical protein